MTPSQHRLTGWIRPGVRVARPARSAVSGPAGPHREDPVAVPASAPRRRTPPELYAAAAHEASARVIARYSTSFGLAVRLLAEPVRSQVRDVYAMVRVADEVVDGAAAHLPPEQVRSLLDTYEAEVLAVCERGFSTDLVVHAFALTARATGIGPELVTPFFASMRADLDTTSHDRASLDTYVYGSAEVVGLMCLRTFLAGDPHPDEAFERLAPGARRLGAAFQKVNFLRDLATDSQDLGRSYVPGLDVGALDVNALDVNALDQLGGSGDGPVRPGLDEAVKARLVAEVDADLAAADAAVRLLPDSSRTAVRTAHLLFTELNRTIEATAVDELLHRRVRVSDPRKAALLTRAMVREGRVPARVGPLARRSADAAGSAYSAGLTLGARLREATGRDHAEARAATAPAPAASPTGGLPAAPEPLTQD